MTTHADFDEVGRPGNRSGTKPAYPHAASSCLLPAGACCETGDNEVIAPRNVVVATDFGDAAARALQYGLEFAVAFGSRLHVVHVADDLAARGLPLVGMLPLDAPSAERTAEAEARRALGTLVTDERMRTVDVRPVVLRNHETARALLDYAREIEADLVVIGTHGRGGLAEFFLGSVAQRVVRSATCPVLTVRANEREFLSIDASLSSGSLH